MTGHLIEPAIKALIEARNFTALHKVFEAWTPADVAECIVDWMIFDSETGTPRLVPSDLAASLQQDLPTLS